MRYLDWRDQRSSSRTLGFRIEGTYQDSQAKKDFKSVKSHEDVLGVLIGFIRQNNAKNQYLRRLREIDFLCRNSTFFKEHQMIGSSLLFVNDETSANIWMIDFAKTTRSESCNANLSPGENGYLAGLENLISFIENINL